MKLAALLLLLAPAFAADLAVSNVHLDAKRTAVEFDLANAGTKPVHAWLVDVFVGDLMSRVTPENCTPAGAQKWHCVASVDFDGRIPAGTPNAHVTSVLFEDGTATGDLQPLQDEIDNASLRVRALEGWQKDFHNTPPEIASNRFVMDERKIVEAYAAKETPEQISAMLQARLKMAREMARLFPEHNPRYAPEKAVASQLAIADHASRFPIVREEEQNGRIRLVMRNDYEKEIAAFVFIEHQPDGTRMRSSSGNTIRPGGLREFDYGPMKNPVELACVLFRDGTADGDPAIVQKMRDGEAGRRAETDRILPLVRAVAALPASEQPAATESLIDELKSHPQEQPDADHNIDYVLGQQAARKAAIREVRDSATIDEALKNLQSEP